jgi:hypothetical protein
MKYLVFIFSIFNFQFSIVNAQTRLYYNNAGTTPFFWNYNGNWTVNTSGQSGTPRMLWDYPVTRSSTLSPSSGQIGATAPPTGKMILNGFATKALDAQTLNCTVRIQGFMKFSPTSAGTTAQEIIYVRLFNEDGTLSRELGNAVTNTNLTFGATTYTNVYAVITLTSQVITKGQRIILEEGVNVTASTLTTTIGTKNYGFSIANPDAPLDNTTSGVANLYNAWIEFSQTLKYQYKQGLF